MGINEFKKDYQPRGFQLNKYHTVAAGTTLNL